MPPSRLTSQPRHHGRLATVDATPRAVTRLKGGRGGNDPGDPWKPLQGKVIACRNAQRRGVTSWWLARAQWDPLNQCGFRVRVIRFPDGEFVLRRDGPVVVCSPCSGHGFKFAPAVGRLTAALATGEMAVDDAATRPVPDLFW